MKNLSDLTHEYRYDYQRGLFDYVIRLEVTPQEVYRGYTQLRVKKTITCVDTNKSYKIIDTHRMIRVLSLGTARRVAADFINECIQEKIIK